MQAIEQRLDEIDAMARIWPDELKACAGAVVYLSHAGEAEIERGLIRARMRIGMMMRRDAARSKGCRRSPDAPRTPRH